MFEQRIDFLISVVKKLISILLLILALNAGAQKAKIKYLTTFDDKKIHFGFSLGINSLDFGIKHYSPIGNNPAFEVGTLPLLEGEKRIVGTDIIRGDIKNNVPGFTVAIIASMRLTQDLELRFLPGLSFGERRLVYNVPVLDVNNSFDLDNYEYSIKSTFIDFPLLVKYKARRINNDRPYVLFGLAYRQDISRTAREDLVRLKKGGLYAELGAGWDTYMLFFRFSIEAKVSIGIFDQLGQGPDATQRQYYTTSIDKLTSNIFTLAFNFE